MRQLSSLQMTMSAPHEIDTSSVNEPSPSSSHLSKIQTCKEGVQAPARKFVSTQVLTTSCPLLTYLLLTYLDKSLDSLHTDLSHCKFDGFGHREAA